MVVVYINSNIHVVISQLVGVSYRVGGFVKKVTFGLLLLLAISPLCMGMAYMEYFQSERAFVRCLETVNPALLVIDYQMAEKGFYFSYAQKPEAEVNEASWKDLADCQNKDLNNTTLYLQAVVVVPITTIYGKLEFVGFTVLRGILTDEMLDRELLPEDFQFFEMYEVGFEVIGNGYHLEKELQLMRKYYANR